MRKHSGQLLLLRSAGQPKQNNVGCRDTDALELQPLRDSPFRTQRITVREKLGAPRRPSLFRQHGSHPAPPTESRQTLLNFISVNSQDSAGARNPSLGEMELFRASGTCRAPFHLLARSWMRMFHRNRAQGGKSMALTTAH